VVLGFAVGSGHFVEGTEEDMAASPFALRSLITPFVVHRLEIPT